jgi:hypothetical protein
MACLLRWVLDGARGPGGTRVRLEACRISGKWVTTPGALRRFVEAQTPEFAGAGPAAKRRSARQRRRAAERADRELEKAGI